MTSPTPAKPLPTSLEMRRSTLLARAAERPSVWDPEHAQCLTNSTSVAMQRSRESGFAVGDVAEGALVSALTTQASPFETAREAGDRREIAIAGVLRALDARQAYALERRLAAESPSDSLVAAFARLSVDRRQRLRQALAAHRRSLALAARG